MTKRTMEKLTAILLPAGLIIAGIVALAALVGCYAPMPGFRFAPGEEQKQSAQTADDLAKGLRHTGVQPGSTAAATLAKATGPPRAFAGEPSNPVDITPLVESQRGAWETKQAQIDTWKLKENLQARANVITATSLAALAESVQDKGKIAAVEIVRQAGAIADFFRMTGEFTQGIAIPSDKAISADEQARLDALTAATDKIIAAASAQASRRPTIGEVADKAEDTALTTIDQVGNILESYGLLALIPGAGGLVYAARKRKAAKQSQTDADDARAEADNAVREALAAKETVAAVKSETAEIVNKAMERLAMAPPPVQNNQHSVNQ